MGRVNITNIIERYQAGFGYVATNLAVLSAKTLWRKTLGSDIPIYEAASTSFANLLLKNSQNDATYAFGIQETADGKIISAFTPPALKRNQESENLFIAPPPMVTFYRDKNVVRTPIDRSENEVIEYFGLKPFEMRFQGILVDTEEHQYPKDLLIAINEMFTAPGTYCVEGDIFNDLGITEIFFDGGFEISFVEGYADTIKYNVRAISTAPAEIKAKGY
jgi:hypothetical protein